MKVKIEIQSPSGKNENIDLNEVIFKSQESLLEWTEEKSNIIAFGCRVGSCGNCMVEVEAGMDLLEPMTPQEDDTLSRMAKSPASRLACRARFKSDASGLLKIKTIF